MPSFHHLRTNKFPILEGEENEIVNPGTYGKSFAQFIKKSLIDEGYDVPFIVCEDWGWWVEIKLQTKSLGVACYREEDEELESDFTCTLSIDKNRIWSWSKLRFIDIGNDLTKINSTLKNAFESDNQINYFSECEEMPLYK